MEDIGCQERELSPVPEAGSPAGGSAQPSVGRQSSGPRRLAAAPPLPSSMRSVSLESNCYDDAISQHMEILQMVSLYSS